MARVWAEKAKNEQLANDTVSSATQHESTCVRCGGLMVTDFYMDVLFCIGETEVAANRCVQCGEIVDPVILHNRGVQQVPKTTQLAGRMLPINCVTKGR
ncbi:MAG: hypothetical protein HXY51_07005 [Nitrospirae bacterium]|nr:hypothetical protein [Nitrospirota bacterium]